MLTSAAQPLATLPKTQKDEMQDRCLKEAHDVLSAALQQAARLLLNPELFDAGISEALTLIFHNTRVILDRLNPTDMARRRATVMPGTGMSSGIVIPQMYDIGGPLAPSSAAETYGARVTRELDSWLDKLKEAQSVQQGDPFTLVRALREAKDAGMDDIAAHLKGILMATKKPGEAATPPKSEDATARVEGEGLRTEVD